MSLGPERPRRQLYGNMRWPVTPVPSGFGKLKPTGMTPTLTRILTEHNPSHPALHNTATAKSFRRRWWANPHYAGHRARAATVFFVFGMLIPARIHDVLFSHKTGFQIVPIYPSNPHGPGYYSYVMELREHYHRMGHKLIWRWWDDRWHPWDTPAETAAE